MKTVKFILWDEETDGIAVEVDGRQVWQETSADFGQYLRHYMPCGVPVLLDWDSRPSERDGQADDDPRPDPVVVSWDWQEQPDMRLIADAVRALSEAGHPVHMREYQDGSDSYTWIVSAVKLDDQAAETAVEATVYDPDAGQ